LNVEHTKLRSMLECEFSGLFAVGGFDDWEVSRELTLEQITQVSALGYVVFGYEDAHGP